jgi:hypothetical protein
LNTGPHLIDGCLAKTGLTIESLEQAATAVPRSH